MNSKLASLGKNSILTGILILSVLNFIYNWLNWEELLGIQSFAGLGYIFLSCYEYLNASYKASLPVQRFPYFSSRFVMLKTLKVSLFFACAALLYTSGTRVQYIYPICLIIATTETFITFLKYKNSLCFVNIYANYLLFAEDKISKLFASEIMIIEFRHDIFYFVKKNTKSMMIKLEHVQDKEGFLLSINDWINRNNVLVSAESRVKIKELID